MKKIATALVVGALSLTFTAAYAQTAQRVRGTITAAKGDDITVKAMNGRTVDVLVTDKTNIVFGQRMAITDIKPGDFLGVTSVRRKDGTLTAYDIRRFIKPSNPGHRPFDGSTDQTMTNANVSATVQGTSGRELTLNYEGGSQKVNVADTAAIVSLAPGQRSQLTPGSYVSLLAEPAGSGKLEARSIEVRNDKDTPKPPQ
jgi:hypothetical protein